MKVLSTDGLTKFIQLVKTTFSTKQDNLISGTNIKTINNQSLLGSGNISISSGSTYTAGNYIDITNNVISGKVSTNTGLVTPPSGPQTTYYAWTENRYNSDTYYTTSATPSTGDHLYWYYNGTMQDQYDGYNGYVYSVDSNYAYIVDNMDRWEWYRDSAKDIALPGDEPSDDYAPSQKAVKTYVDNNSLPSQSGNSGKYLTTNGTTASWATVNSLPSQSGNSGKFLTTNGTTASWSNAVVTLTGAQTISGSKTVSGTTTFSGTTNFTGTVSVTTPSISDNSTKPATTAYINDKFQVVDTLPDNPISGVLYFVKV